VSPNTSTSLQTTLAAEAKLEEGQFLLAEDTSNKEKPLIYLTETGSPTVSKEKDRI
jgi:hypothetical protein